MEYRENVECYGVQEIVCEGISTGNPFMEQSIEGSFTHGDRVTPVKGFYDGEGRYIVRFMPEETGEYSFRVYGSFGEGGTGTFRVTDNTGLNHGPVRVANTFHFAYADGTPFYPVGTTCYVWELQAPELQRKTLDTLSEGYFNKIRFCIFPKHYDYNQHEPVSYPFEGTPMDSSVLTPDNFMKYDGNSEGNDFDFTRPNPEHFRHIEDCIRALAEIGVEADLILFHPYDRWGFSLLDREQDLFYLRYVLARFSAFRNVWWSMANEFDLMCKTPEDWDAIGECISREDPFRHLVSNHNCVRFFDHTKPYITHVCGQRTEFYRSTELVDSWREQYGKPVIMDEIMYEGNIQHAWGNISGEELTRRFWESAVRGGYAGHGETYLSGDRILWWSHGGVLKGTSPERLRFLGKILSETPGHGLRHLEAGWDNDLAVPENESHESLSDYSYYLYYYGRQRPSFRDFRLREDCRYTAEVIDTWEMTVTPAGEFSGRCRIELPGKEFIALRIRRIS